jgi:antitoxin component YwqK of YwqJK toxin-antitoxin module
MSAVVTPECPPHATVHVESSVTGPDTWRFCARRNGVKDGPELLFHEDGSLRMRGQWVDGRREGEFVMFTPAGVVTSQVTYVHGEPNGAWTYHDDQGQPEWEDTYVNGVKQGPYTAWYPSGQVREHGEYVDGEQSGPWQSFEDDGHLASEGSYVDGRHDGTWTTFAGGVPVLRQHWVAGQREGVSESFYPNGQPYHRGRYEHDVQVGIWTTWNPDGTILHEADPRPCEQGAKALATELYAEPSHGEVRVRLDASTFAVTGWKVDWGAIHDTAWRDPALIDRQCVPGPRVESLSAAWTTDLDPATVAAADHAVALTTVPSAIIYGGYFDGWELHRDGDALIATIRGMWLE